MKFTNSKIKEDQKKVSEIIKNARLNTKKTLNEVSEQINIKQDYLNFIEKGEYDKLPNGIYKKTFLKNYAEYLNLDTEKILKHFQEELNKLKSEKKQNVFSKEKIKKHELLVFPKILKNIIVGLVISIFFLYIGFYLKKSFTPPSVTIINPVDNITIEQNSIEIIGKTNPKTQILINNKLILKKDSGFFKEEINLKKGINTIIISAKNKYSKERIIKRQILVK